MASEKSIEARPAELLQRLIRFDTSNPPGNEAACVDFIENLLRDAGVTTQRFERAPGRPNLIARLPGRGEAPGLLFYGHVDVVPADPGGWTYPPFEGRIVDGCVWGRGALDMKGGVAMMVSAFLRAAKARVVPPGDLVLALLVDEEAGGRNGAEFLVESHPQVFAGVRYAIGEFGGFPLRVLGRTFYLIQVAEKGPVAIELVVRGAAGHGARPMRGGAMAKLGAILSRLDGHRFPIHITPVTRRTINTIAAHLPPAEQWMTRQLLNPVRTDRVLRRLGEIGREFEPLFRNTVNATIVRGGDRLNVIPDEIHVGLDGRLLPGYTVDDLLGELEPVIRDDAEVEVPYAHVPPPTTDLALFAALERGLVERDSEAIVVPYTLPGSSDGRHLTRLGIQTYGYTPMNLPPDVSFFETIHAADERVPVTAVEFGTDVLLSLMRDGGV